MSSLKPYFWAGLFLLLFLLALDYWRWTDPVEPGWLGLPGWLGGFVALQLVLTLSIWLFTRYGWVDKNNGERKD